MAKIRVKRGTRAALDAAGLAEGLAAGEPYLITDEGRMAVGTSATAYAPVLVSDQARRITVSTTAPASPALNDLWLQIP